MTLRLEGKTAFITGGNSGIGLASAKAFIEQGAKVIIMARSKAKADAALLELGNNAKAFVGDVGNYVSIKNVFEDIKTQFGKLDIVMANAGIAPVTPLADVMPSEIDRVFDVNVKGAFYTVQCATPILTKGASVILVSSCLNEMGMEGYSIYNASKAAVRSLARSLTPDLAQLGARINVLSPGPIHTPVLENAGIPSEQVKLQYQVFEKALSAGRVGKPREMANIAVFLASSESSYMYGSEIQADGGMNQTRWSLG